MNDDTDLQPTDEPEHDAGQSTEDPKPLVPDEERNEPEGGSGYDDEENAK